MSIRPTALRSAALVFVLAWAVACDTPEDQPAETEQLEEGGDDPFIDEEEAETLPDPDVEEEATDPGVPLLGTATSEEYGEYLTDGDGRALYVSAIDPPGESECTDACLQEWPIVSVDDDREIGEGVDEQLVGAIERDDLPDDSFEQVTYRDKPLHYHVQDELPEQVTGQGTDDQWFLISPDGVEIRD
jgi:predicted lipoprotein with Yx(FWY)xxD motif